MRMKVTPKLVTVIALVAAISIAVPVLSGCLPGAPAAPAAPAAPEQTWHLRGISPQVRSVVERDSIPHYTDVVTEMTGGRVTFDWYAGGELMPSEEEIPAIQAGTIDMLQWYPLMGTATDLRTIETGAPFATKNAIEFRALIYQRGLMELFAESYEEIGIHYLGPSLHDPLEITSRLPAYSLEDMKGQRIQLLAEHAYPFEKVGVVTLATPPADVYLAIQTGAMDGFGWSGADEIVMFGMNEVAPYLWDPPFVDTCNVAYLINQEVWDSMPSDIQAILKYATREIDLWNETIRASNEWARRTDDSFTEITFLPESDIEVLRGYGMEYLDIIATRSPRVAEAVRIIKEFRAEVDEAKWYGH